MPRKRYITIPQPRPAMEARIMLALRAGPLTMQQLDARFGGMVHMGGLISHGLVVSERNGPMGLNAVEYGLTEAGRAACPRWRDLCKPESGLDGAPA